MDEYILLDLHSLAHYEPLLPPKTLSEIATITPDLKLIAYGAVHEGKPIGIAAALLDRDLHTLEIQHIEVIPSERNRHVGRTLLAKVQEEATRQGAKFFSFIYPIKEPDSTAIEKIIDANHWKGSRPFLIKAYFNPVTFNASITRLNYEYPPGYREFPWKDLSGEQRRDLQFREKQGQFSRAISPFLDEEKMETLNSLGLEYEGRVVGWIINHRIDGFIRYTAFYIEPSLKYRGLAMKLMSNSINLHRQFLKEMAFTEVPYLIAHPSYIQFVERRLVPVATKVTRLQQRWHTV